MYICNGDKNQDSLNKIIYPTIVLSPVKPNDNNPKSR
jgi:hypothetical protein